MFFSKFSLNKEILFAEKKNVIHYLMFVVLQRVVNASYYGIIKACLDSELKLKWSF